MHALHPAVMAALGIRFIFILGRSATLVLRYVFDALLPPPPDPSPHATASNSTIFLSPLSEDSLRVRPPIPSHLIQCAFDPFLFPPPQVSRRPSRQASPLFYQAANSSTARVSLTRTWCRALIDECPIYCPSGNRTRSASDRRFQRSLRSPYGPCTNVFLIGTNIQASIISTQSYTCCLYSLNPKVLRSVRPSLTHVFA